MLELNPNTELEKERQPAWPVNRSRQNAVRKAGQCAGIKRSMQTRWLSSLPIMGAMA